MFWVAGKSTLWTNTGQDWNFQRTLSAIGPYEFRGKFIWANHWSIPFPGEIRMDRWSWKFFESFPLHWYWSMDGSSQSSESLYVANLLQSSKTIRNWTLYQKQYRRVLWVIFLQCLLPKGPLLPGPSRLLVAPEQQCWCGASIPAAPEVPEWLDVATAPTQIALQRTLWHESITKSNPLRIIFRNFWGILSSSNSQERKTFSRNYAWNS